MYTNFPLWNYLHKLWFYITYVPVKVALLFILWQVPFYICFHVFLNSVIYTLNMFFLHLPILKSYYFYSPKSNGKVFLQYFPSVDVLLAL